jgi:hypothetical protein
MKHSHSEVDPKELVSGVSLPYFVPVDFVVRGFLAFLTFGYICAVYVLLLDKSSQTLLTWMILAAIGSGLVYLNVRPGGICIREDGIELRRRFFWFIQIRWPDIVKVQTGTQRQLRINDPLRGPYVTMLQLLGNNRPILLNIKPYSAKGLCILAAFLITRATNAELDKATIAMTKRQFPSLLFANGQKGI